MITIVIPSRTDEHLERLFLSIEKSDPGLLELRAQNGAPLVIVADNGLSDAFRERYADRIAFIPTELPFVFSRAMNDGVRAALPGSDLLLMNDDTEILSPYFVRSLTDSLGRTAMGGFGLVSPRIVGGVGNPSQMQQLGPDEVREVSTTICFVCVLIPRNVWELVGPMDEQFVDYGFDDDDYCRRVRTAGWKCGVTGAGALRHGTDGRSMSGTFAKIHGPAELREMFFKNKDRLDAKFAMLDRDNRSTRRVVSDLTKGRRLALSELSDRGYLQEANRLFFHPLGLTLQVKFAPGGDAIDFYVLDLRDIPEGVFLDDGVLSAEKAERVEAELLERREIRVKELGWSIQPVPSTR